MKKARKPSKVDGKKKAASAAKTASKGLSSAKTKKPLKRPSSAKAQGVQKGVLSGLRPPLPHQVKSSQYSCLFDRFYDRHDYYIAYGPFYLIHAVYWLKLHHRPEPIDAIKVLEEEIENITQKKTAMLLEWGLSPEDARRVVESSHQAWLLDFSKKVLGCNDPDQIFSNEKMRERAMVVSAKHDLGQLSEVLNSDLVRKSGSSIEAIFERFYRAIKESTTGLNAWRSDPNDWEQKIICLWVAPPWGNANGKWPEKIPPVCMWSSGAIAGLLVGRESGASDDTVRQSIKRLGLCRPSHPVPTYGVSKWGEISFVPRTRGRFDS